VLPARGATWLDPALKWKTIETPHFSINYYPEIEETARRLAPIAEEVHKTMSEVLRYKLDMKTQVTLMDTTDYGNGFTTVFPYPSVTLYLTDLSSNLNPYKYDNYLRYLFLHEYVHALHLDMAEGGIALFRLIFGRVVFPNAMEPWFITEGLATYMETEYTNAGRGRDPRWEMMMRMDILEDNVKSIDQAAVNTVRWPLGHLRYLYGVEFLQWLSQTYGQDRLIALTHVYGDFLFSMGIDGAFVFLYHKNLSMLWNDWLDYCRDKFQKQKASLGKLTEPVTLTQGGYYNLKPKWSKDSSAIYYVQRNADDYPQIRRLELNTGKNAKIYEGQVFDEGLSLSPDGKVLLFSKADTYKNFYTFKDLYVLDLRSQRISQLTSGMRASEASFSPDGGRIAFVKNDKGIKTLLVLEGGKTRTLLTGSQYFSPVFSVDGNSVAMSKQVPGGGQKICMVDLAVSREVVLLNNVVSSIEPVSEANPAFSPNGEYLFFDADYNGIVDLYAFHLPSGRLFQVTNVIGGAMMPDVSPDGKKLAYVSYSSRGYDIAMMDVNPSQWKEMSASQPVSQSASQDAESYEGRKTGRQEDRWTVHDYNPWPTLLPRFWIPDSYRNENGEHTSIYIGGMDPLGQHLYYLNLGYDFDVSRPYYSFYYANDQFPPQIIVGLYDYSSLYDWNGQNYWERDKEAVLLFSLYDNRVFSEYDRQAFTFGVQNINLTNVSSLDTLVPPLPDRGNINGILLGWRYKNDRAYPFSISSEDGLDLSLKLEMNPAQLNSDYEYNTYSGTLKNYFKTLLKHHILASKLNGFYSKGDQLEQSNFTWRYLSLRGYPYGYFKGNKGASLSLEYRFPLFYPERGVLYGLTFFDRLWASIFYDLGGATFDPFNEMAYKRGVGAELNLDTSTFWGYYYFMLKLGYAKGLDEGGEEKVYFTLGL
jgi:Tol biopolymer transport system component